MNEQTKQVTNELDKLLTKLVLILTFGLISAFSTSAQVNLLEMRGDVKDQQNAIIVNAQIVLTGENNAQKAVTNQQGKFRFDNLTTGTYTLQVFAEGFNQHQETVELNLATKPSPISIVLYPTVRADVEIKETTEATLDSERAAGTQILSATELESLPDDPEQLNQQLQQLAASSGSAPGEAVVTVDGFLTGGRLPSKSAISIVRINPNLFSAEYDTPPYRGGRIEVVTKPGADSLGGSVFFNYNPTNFNARDPLAAARAQNETRRYGFQFGAPIVKKRIGFLLDFEKRDIDEAAIVNAVILDDCFEPTIFAFNAPNPKRLVIGSARADWQINRNHTTVFRFDTNRNKTINQGVGGTNLPERGFNSNQTQNNLRFTETAIINSRTVNELRFGLTLSKIEQRATNNEPAVVVAGAFAAGGANVQQLARDERQLEITDYLTTSIGKHNFKLGVQIYNRRVAELRAENTNGTFFFGGGSIRDNSTQAISISSLEQYRRALSSLPGGVPTQLSVTRGAPVVAVNQWLIAGFVQDEWRASQKLSFGIGLRYEAQTVPSDRASFAPRLSLAYTPDKRQNWVFRVRGGLFYQRIIESLALETERLDGFNQQQIIVDSPVGFPNLSLSETVVNAIPTVRFFDPALNPPASFQLRFEIERQLPRGWKISASHSWSRGWSALRSRNINAPIVNALNPDLQTALRPFGIAENRLQFESSGQIAGRVLYLGVNQNANKFFNLNFGYLNFDFKTDADTPFALPQSSYDLTGEWARPFWQTSHQVFLTATTNLFWKLRLAVILNANSGAPYNITTGRDNNGDGNFNDRPSTAASIHWLGIQTTFGNLNPNVLNGNLPRNAGTNPANVTLDLNLSRTFIFGKTSGEKANRYRLTGNIRAANALNRSNLSAVNGVLTSPLFGRATLANPARRIEFGLRFSF